MLDWIIDNMWWMLIVIFGTACLVLVVAFREEGRIRQEFMEECIRHEPKYKCTAMWRAANTSHQVYPMPVVIPAGR